MTTYTDYKFQIETSTDATVMPWGSFPLDFPGQLFEALEDMLEAESSDGLTSIVLMAMAPAITMIALASEYSRDLIGAPGAPKDVRVRLITPDGKTAFTHGGPCYTVQMGDEVVVDITDVGRNLDSGISDEAHELAGQGIMTPEVKDFVDQKFPLVDDIVPAFAALSDSDKMKIMSVADFLTESVSRVIRNHEV